MNIFWFVVRHWEDLEPPPGLSEVEDTIESLARRDSVPTPGSCPRSPPIPPKYTAPGVPWWRDCERRYPAEPLWTEPTPEPPRHRWPQRERPEPPAMTAEQAAELTRTPEQIAEAFRAELARLGI